MIQFREREIKNLVLESLPKLRTAAIKFKNVSVCHDLTKNERNNTKSWSRRPESKQSDDQSGDYIYRVKGQPGNMSVERLKKH